jgi:hypothetical protein
MIMSLTARSGNFWHIATILSLHTITNTKLCKGENLMASITDAVSLGGTVRPQPDTKVAVSFWHIPGGSDYERARAVQAYFSDEEAAKRFAEKYYYPPEMAMVMPYPPKQIQTSMES